MGHGSQDTWMKPSKQFEGADSTDFSLYFAVKRQQRIARVETLTVVMSRILKFSSPWSISSMPESWIASMMAIGHSNPISFVRQAKSVIIPTMPTAVPAAWPICSHTSTTYSGWSISRIALNNGDTVSSTIYCIFCRAVVYKQDCPKCKRKSNRGKIIRN